MSCKQTTVIRMKAGKEINTALEVSGNFKDNTTVQGANAGKTKNSQRGKNLGEGGAALSWTIDGRQGG